MVPLLLFLQEFVASKWSQTRDQQSCFLFSFCFVGGVEIGAYFAALAFRGRKVL